MNVSFIQGEPNEFFWYLEILGFTEDEYKKAIGF